MNIDIRNHNRFLRFTGIAAAFIFGILSILGSGGGDDDGGGGDTSVGLLPSYTFNINTAAAYDGANQQSDGITVSVSSIPATVRIDPAVTGTFICDPTTELCGLNTIATGSLINIFDASSVPVVGNLSITIAEEVIIGVSGQPVLGRIHITLVPGTDFIDITMATCPSGAGVNVSFNGSPYPDPDNSCFTWDEFEQLFETSEDPVLIAAVFGFQIINFLFEQVNFVTEVFGFIGEFAVDLEQSGTISETCDAFSSAVLVPPTGVADQGMRSLSWTDVNTDGNAGPGDSFLGSLEDCWISPDQLLNGLADFTGYVENVDQNRGVITAIGFTSVTPPNPGGAFFTGFTISETEETSPGSGLMEITNVIGVDGGFSILFTEP